MYTVLLHEKGACRLRPGRDSSRGPELRGGCVTACRSVFGFSAHYPTQYVLLYKCLLSKLGKGVKDSNHNNEELSAGTYSLALNPAQGGFLE